MHLQDRLRTQETYGEYFKEEVRKQLVEQFGAERVYEGGLKVYTTMDPDLQRTAEAEVMRAVRDRGAAGRGVRRIGSGDEALQGALVALDPSTGRSASHRRRSKLRREPLQSRHAEPAAGRFCVQTVRLRGCP